MEADDRRTVESVFVEEFCVQILQFGERIGRQLKMTAADNAFAVHHLIEFLQLFGRFRLLRKRTEIVLHLPEIEDVFGDIFTLRFQ